MGEIVYVVYEYYSYENCPPEAVFSTKELAEEFCSKNKYNNYKIIEFVVDEK